MKKFLHTVLHFISSLRTVIGSAYRYSKGGTRILFTILLFFAVSGILFFFQTFLINQSVVVPRSGGTLTEGLIGSPVSVDPLSAVSETEQALTRVFFSDVSSLASSIAWNDSHTTATIKIKDGIRFHDKKPLTVDDILFTYEKAKNSTNQSTTFYDTLSRTTLTSQGPLLLTVSSSAEIPSSFFTLGIIPKHIWEKDVVSLRESMIGTGPFKAKRIISKNNSITHIVTTRFSAGALPTPYIRKIRFVFFENTERLMNAILEKTVKSATVSANEFDIPTENFTILPTDEAVALYALPSYNGIFSPTYIKALEEVIDKNQILATVRNSYGSTSGSYTPFSESFSEESQNLLKQKGVVFTKEGTISQSPSTTLYLRDDPELINTAQLLQNYYGKLGLPIELKIFSRGVFREEIEKNPQALVLGYTTDTIVSSQRLLFPLFSLGVGNYAKQSIGIVNSPFNIRRRYEHIHTWSLRKELQWKKNKQE
jgi:ABC-type transport system substrate-binding protein